MLSGVDGNDFVFGSNRKDALFGGEGFNLFMVKQGYDTLYSGVSHDAKI